MIKMPICKKCHRWKKSKVLAYHKKDCIPTKEDLENYAKSRTGGMTKDEKTKQKEANKK